MNGELIAVGALDAATRGAMCALLDRHFEGVAPDAFERDLGDKQWALLIRDEARAIAGFSTFAVVRAEADGAPLGVVYSGDTIVDAACRRSSALARCWITAVRALGEAHPRLPLVWLLICSGYRTYRFLPVFFREFYPRFDRPTPAAVRRLMERLARRRYGDAFEAGRGIVRLEHPQPLRPHLRGLRRGDEHAAFFARANPGHESGEELVCLASLGADNLNAAGQRVVRAGCARPLAS